MTSTCCSASTRRRRSPASGSRGCVTSMRSSAPKGAPGSGSTAALSRSVTLDGDTVTATAGGPEDVVDPVLRAPVVPKGDVAGRPVGAHRKIGPGRLGEQPLQEGGALFFRQPDDGLGEDPVDEQGLAARLRMGAHHRML